MRAFLLVVVMIAIVPSVRGASPADPSGRLVPDLAVREFALCPDGRTVAVRTDAKAMLVDWPGGGVRPVLGNAELPPCAAVALGFSPDGRLYARTSPGGTIAIVDAATSATRTTLTGHLGTVRAAVFSPDGRWLASGGFDNDVRLWDVAAGTCVRTLTSPSHATFAIVWAPDSRTFYTGGASQTVTAWNAATGERLRESASLGRPVTDLAISADGRRLAAGTFTADGTRLAADLHVMDRATFADERVISSPDGGTVSVAFSPDGRQVLWASTGGRGIMVTSLEH
jgi:WD40 repeat protein